MRGVEWLSGMCGRHGNRIVRNGRWWEYEEKGSCRDLDLSSVRVVNGDSESARTSHNSAHSLVFVTYLGPSATRLPFITNASSTQAPFLPSTCR